MPSKEELDKRAAARAKAPAVLRALRAIVDDPTHLDEKAVAMAEASYGYVVITLGPNLAADRFVVRATTLCALVDALRASAKDALANGPAADPESRFALAMLRAQGIDPEVK